MSSRFLPLVWWSLPVLLATGAIMIIGEPARSLKNPAFQLKMTLAGRRTRRHRLFQFLQRRNAAFGDLHAGPRAARHDRDRLDGAVVRIIFCRPLDRLLPDVAHYLAHLEPKGTLRWILIALCEWLQATAIATAIRENEILFPWIESVHVLAIVLVVGTISIVDLRLLGIASLDRTVGRLMRDVLPVTWGAFAVAR